MHTLALLLVLSPVADAVSAGSTACARTTAAEAAKADGQASTESTPRSPQDIAEALGTTVISVTSYIKVPSTPSPTGRWEIADESPYPGYMRNLVASGMVIDEKGTLICCRSPLVTADGGLAEIIDAELSSGTRYRAELIASEPTINLAVLRLTPPEGGDFSELRPIVRASSMSMRAGDRVFAVGDPFGSARTFAPGVVMSLPATACYQSDLTGSLIHASMAIAPGAVGGALVNETGAVVGLLVPEPQLRPEERTNPLPFVTYAMPLETAFGVGEALMKKRTNESPWMGFSVLSREELEKRLGATKYEAVVKPAHGIYIDDMYDAGPGAKAGVKSGDFLMSVSGAKVVSVVDFQQALYYNFGGTPVQIEVFRDGRVIPLMIRIETRPPEANRR
jgi:S1-C subfamily serine protease